MSGVSDSRWSASDTTPGEIETPSFGCIVRISWFGWTPTEPSCLNARCGTGLSVTAISVVLRASRLPVRR